MAETLGKLEFEIDADFSKLLQKWEKFEKRLNGRSSPNGGSGAIKLNLDLSKAEKQLNDFDKKIARTRVIKIDADISAAEAKINRLLGKLGGGGLSVAAGVGGGGSPNLGGLAAGAFLASGAFSSRASARLPVPSGVFNVPNQGIRLNAQSVNMGGGQAVVNMGSGVARATQRMGANAFAGANATSGGTSSSYPIYFPPEMGGEISARRSSMTTRGRSMGNPQGIVTRASGSDIGSWLYSGSAAEKGNAGLDYEGGGGKGGGDGFYGRGFGSADDHKRYRDGKKRYKDILNPKTSRLRGMLKGAGIAYVAAQALNLAEGYSGMSQTLANSHNPMEQHQAAAGFASQVENIIPGLGLITDNLFGGKKIKAETAQALHDAEKRDRETERNVQRGNIRKGLNRALDDTTFSTNIQTSASSAVRTGSMSAPRAQVAAQVASMNRDIELMANDYKLVGDKSGEGAKKIAAARKASQDYAIEALNTIAVQESAISKFRGNDIATGAMRLGGNVRGAARFDIANSFDLQIEQSTDPKEQAYLRAKKQQAIAQHDKDTGFEASQFIQGNKAAGGAASLRRRNLYSDQPDAAASMYELTSQRDMAVQSARNEGRSPAEIQSIMQSFGEQMQLLTEQIKKNQKELERSRTIDIMGQTGRIKAMNLQAQLKPNMAEVAGIQADLNQRMLANEGITDPSFKKKKDRLDLEESKARLGLLGVNMTTGGSVQEIGGYMNPKGMNNPELDVAEALKAIKTIIDDINKKLAKM